MSQSKVAGLLPISSSWSQFPNYMDPGRQQWESMWLGFYTDGGGPACAPSCSRARYAAITDTQLGSKPNRWGFSPFSNASFLKKFQNRDFCSPFTVSHFPPIFFLFVFKLLHMQTLQNLGKGLRDSSFDSIVYNPLTKYPGTFTWRKASLCVVKKTLSNNQGRG